MKGRRGKDRRRKGRREIHLILKFKTSNTLTSWLHPPRLVSDSYSVSHLLRVSLRPLYQRLLSRMRRPANTNLKLGNTREGNLSSRVTADVVIKELSPDGAMERGGGTVVSFININQVRID